MIALVNDGLQSTWTGAAAAPFTVLWRRLPQTTVDDDELQSVPGSSFKPGTQRMLSMITNPKTATSVPILKSSDS
jgi:hypothetical protein